MRYLAILFFFACGALAQHLTLNSAVYGALLGRRATPALLITNDLVLWLKADGATNLVDNSDVQHWPDSSTNNKPAFTSTGFNPTFRMNSRGSLPGIEFNGTDDQLNGTTPTTSNTCSMFLVAKWESTNAFRTVFRVGDTTTGFGLNNNANGQRDILHRAVAECLDGPTGTVTEMWSTVRTPAPLEQLWVNGVLQTLSNDGSACAGPSGGDYSLGYFGAAGFFFDGIIYELLLYSVPLGTSDRQSVEAYLTAKWGL